MKLFSMVTIFLGLLVSRESRAEQWIYLGGASNSAHCAQIAQYYGYRYYFFGPTWVNGYIISNACSGSSKQVVNTPPKTDSLQKLFKDASTSILEFRRELAGDYEVLYDASGQLFESTHAAWKLLLDKASNSRIQRQMQLASADFDNLDKEFQVIHKKTNWNAMGNNWKALRSAFFQLEKAVEDLD